jgi:PAS domain S-box-containing protein
MRVDRPMLRLVGDKDYAPLTYLESGVAKGRDVDVARAVAQRLGQEVHIELMDWTEAQQQVRDGRADGLLAMSVTAERREVYDFADPVLVHNFGVFVRTGDRAIRSATDIPSDRLGVTGGGFPRRFLAERGMTNPTVIRNYEDGFNRLRDGTLDAIAADSWVGAHTIEKGQFDGIALAGPSFATLPGGMGFKKGSPLVEDVNRAIRGLQADGTLTRIDDRWRSHEVVFLSRARLQRLAVWTLGVFTLVVAGAAGVWFKSVRKQSGARRELQSAHVEGQRRLHLLAHALQSANDCISITDTSEHLLFVNEALLRTYEYTEQELIGRHIGILRSGHTAVEVLEEMGEATRREGWRGVVWNQSKSGRIFPVSLATSMVRDERGQVIAAIGVARDVGEERLAEERRKELEGKLRQSQKMDALGRLAAGVAHDFNNVLIVILANSDESLQRPDLAPEVRRNFAEISRTAGGAVALTSQLLAFSRQQVLQPRKICLNDVLDDTYAMVARLIGHDVTVRFRPDLEPGWVVADAVQVQQLLVNLALNARDAMPHGGQLTVETRNVSVGASSPLAQDSVPAGDYVMVVAADTGTGMSEETRALIFEPFFTTKDVGKGTGLGLSTVYGTVKQSGGFIVVSSAPGRGTTFNIYFPRVEPDGLPAARTEPAVTQKAPPDGALVLVVDDDPGVREVIGRYVVRAGYQVMLAPDGAEAVALCRTSAPALLITDVTMPGMSGLALAEQLRRQHPGMKVLFVSGLDRPPVAGAHHLQKPFTPDTFAVTVRDILS